MNRTFRQVYGIFFFSLLLALGFSIPKAHAQYDDVTVSYNDFYQDLSHYGQWIEDPQYGYVWSPNEDGSFRPYYTNGHWAMTDYGNTWVSDYPWGWACFHYGRWTFDNYYGWLWIPGQYWGPAWVSWRYGQGYYGWAPLGPGYEFTSSYTEYGCPQDWWVFIPPQYLYSGSYYHYWYGPQGNAVIIDNTTYINNVYVNNNVHYVHGPRTKEVEDVTHQPVQVFRVTNSNNLNTRTHNNVIKMYRPMEIRPSSTVNGQRSMPPNVVTAPQPVRTAQPTGTTQPAQPPFRENVQKTRNTHVPGTNYNPTAQPEHQQRNNTNNPYEWDVNRPITQPQPPDNSQPQNSYRQPQQQPRQAPQQQPRQTPAPQPRPAPQPQQQPQPRQAPAPQQQSRPAPAPASQPGRPMSNSRDKKN
jgi:hypothetical protein